MGERRALGRSLVALTAAICTLGALAITPAANAKTVASASASDSNQTVKAAAAGNAGVDPNLVCPIDKPGVAATLPKGKNIAVYTDEESASNEPIHYVDGLKEAVDEAATLASSTKNNVNITLLRHQEIPTQSQSTPNTLSIKTKVDIDGSGCTLNGQLHFEGASDGSTIENTRFWLGEPNETTANIIANVPLTVTNNDFLLPSTSFVPQNTGTRPANAKRPVGVQIGSVTGSTVSNNVFQGAKVVLTDDKASVTTEPAHNQDQGVRLSGKSANTLISNNTFNVPTGVALAGFTGSDTATIKGNAFSGKYAVVDMNQSDPTGLTYLGKPIVYDQQQDLNGNTLGTGTLPYRGVFAGNRSTAANSSKFEGTSYGVRYLNAKDDTVLGSDAVARNTNPTRIPTRTGFHAELYTDKDTTQLFNATDDMTNNRDGFGEDGDTSSDLGALYVKWYKNVKFDLNGGSGTAPNEEKVYEYTKSADGTTEEGKIDSLPGNTNMTAPAEKTKFLGWSTNKDAQQADFEAGNAYTPEANSTAEITLYAIWASAKFTVSYDANKGEGTAPAAQEVLEGAEDVKVADPGAALKAPAGMKFGGWNTQADGQGTTYQPGATLPKVTANVQLFAHWVPKDKFTVSYDANKGEGTAPAAQEVLEGAEDVKVADPGAALKAPAGMKFGGWNTQADGQGTTYQPGATLPKVTANVQLFAHWVPKDKFTVSYDANGGQDAPKAVEVSKGGQVDSLPDSTGMTAPKDMKFVGWRAGSADKGDMYKSGDIFKPTEDVTLYAQWIPTTSVILSHNANEGTGDLPGDSVVSAGTAVHAGSADKLNHPKGMVFAFWSTRQDGTGEAYNPGDEFYLTMDTMLYAQWVPAGKVIVAYNANGGTGSVPAPQTVDKGAEVTVDSTTVPTAPADKTFAGWNTKKDGSGTTYQSGEKFTVSANTILYAQWRNTGGNGGGSWTPTPGPSTPSVRLIDVHRYYNFRTGEHFYTWDQVEMATLTKAAGWNYEGIAFRMSPDQGTAVYRLYNPGGKHLFTTSENERDVLLRSGWRYEGIPFRVPAGASVKVYRLYNPGNGDHLLTTSANERGVVLFHKWNDEKTAFNSAK